MEWAWLIMAIQCYSYIGWTKHKQKRGNTEKKYGDFGLFKYGLERLQKHMVSCGKPLVCGWILGNVEIEPWFWANYNNSQTWIKAKHGDDFPNPNYDFQGSLVVRSWWNLPRTMTYDKPCQQTWGVQQDFDGFCCKYQKDSKLGYPLVMSK